MVTFIKENLLGSVKEFRNRFINPIQNGQCADSTLVDVRVMKKRAHILYEMLAGCVQVTPAVIALTYGLDSLQFSVRTVLYCICFFFCRGGTTLLSQNSCHPNMSMCWRCDWRPFSVNSIDITWSILQVTFSVQCSLHLSSSWNKLL